MEGLDATGKEHIGQIRDSMAASQAFQAELMVMQNEHQTIMQSYQAQKKMYEQIRA